MGAWSHEPFGNDDALDFLTEVETGGLPTISGLLHHIVGMDEIEADIASMGVAALAVLAAVRSRDTSLLPDTHRGLAQRLGGLDSGLLTTAIKALDRIETDSELAELWAETPEATAWRASLAQIRERLK